MLNNLLSPQTLSSFQEASVSRQRTRVWWICPYANHTGTWENGSMAPLSLTSAPDEGEWSKFNPQLLHFRLKSHGAPQYEAGWAPESIWTLRWICKSFILQITEGKLLRCPAQRQRLQGKACSLLCHICYMLYFPSNHTGEVWLQTLPVKVFSFTENSSPLAPSFLLTLLTTS